MNTSFPPLVPVARSDNPPRHATVRGGLPTAHGPPGRPPSRPLPATATTFALPPLPPGTTLEGEPDMTTSRPEASAPGVVR
jgi:hypothetical protein